MGNVGLNNVKLKKKNKKNIRLNAEKVIPEPEPN
jgi:hypothetical protein